MKAPSIVYVMYDDHTPDHRKRIQRMIALGYRVTTKSVEREYEASQLIGNKTVK
jgi:hypothetical protein